MTQPDTQLDADDINAVLSPSGPIRHLLLELWQRTRIDWSFASNRLANAFRSHKSLSSSQRRLIAETLYGMIRHARRIEAALEHAGLVSQGITDDHRLVAYLVLEAGLAPEAASNAGPRADWARLAGFDSTLEHSKPAQALAVRYSLPDWLAVRLARQHSDAGALAAALTERAPMTVRVNTLVASRDELLAELAEEGLNAHPGALSDTAILFESRVNLFALRSFRRGAFEAMDEGSQLVADLVTPPPKAMVVDLCAGAGGKTLAMAARMASKGRIVATDIGAKKLSELKRRARRAQVSNVQTAVIDGSDRAALPPALASITGKVHRVLIDAPCSGVGSIRRNPESKWRLLERDVDSLVATQLGLIRKAKTLLGPSGRIVYATCTVLAEENRKVVERALAEHTDLALMPVKNVWGRERALAVGDGDFLETLPHRHGCDGFFAAILYRPKAE